MKKTLLILSVIILILAGCKKFDEIEASKVEIVEEIIEKGWDYIKINVEYDYPVELEAVTLYLSEKEDMSGAESYECNLEGKKFSVEVEELKEGVDYYYCYEYDNGYEKERCDVGGLMIITTKEVTNIKVHSATCGGNIIYYGDDEIRSRGVCWSTSPNPKIEDNKTNDGSGTGSYSSTLSNLSDNTTYYVRAYATNEKGTSYGEEKSFTTVEITLPTVTTKEVTNIGCTSVLSGGNVTSDGNSIVTARGVCWSEVQNPNIDNIYCEKTTDGSGTGTFTSYLTNLKPNTTYYVRAYATNEKGTSYGAQKSFTTLEGTFENGYEYVDLGLSVKWATCNVGATTPEEYGDYFAWGETAPKDTYSNSNCPTFGLSKSELQSQGYIDSKGNLTAQYDAATANWGGSWRMPTKAEQEELLDNCTWTWTTLNGVKGCKVAGPNGNSIFLPAAGHRSGSSLKLDGYHGDYWSSTPNDDYDVSFSDDGGAYSLDFYDGFEGVNWYDYRSVGLTVRPITE